MVCRWCPAMWANSMRIRGSWDSSAERTRWFNSKRGNNSLLCVHLAFLSWLLPLIYRGKWGSVSLVLGTTSLLLLHIENEYLCPSFPTLWHLAWCDSNSLSYHEFFKVISELWPVSQTKSLLGFAKTQVCLLQLSVFHISSLFSHPLFLTPYTAHFISVLLLCILTAHAFVDTYRGVHLTQFTCW